MGTQIKEAKPLQIIDLERKLFSADDLQIG
jgi:hypothetical protein